MSVNVEAIRVRLNSDDPTWDRADARALCDEVEQLRATVARVDEALQMLWEEGLAGDGYGLRPHDLIEAALRGDEEVSDG